MIRSIVFSGGVAPAYRPMWVTTASVVSCTALAATPQSLPYVVYGSRGYRYAVNDTPRGGYGYTADLDFGNGIASVVGQVNNVAYNYGAAVAAGYDSALGSQPVMLMLGAPGYLDLSSKNGAVEYSTVNNSARTYVGRLTGAVNEKFGCAIACNQSATVMVVGALNANGPGSPAAASAGRVVVFTRSAGSTTWAQQASLTPFGNTSGEVGSSLAMQEDGSSFVTGAPARLGGPSGRVAFYTGSGSTWTQQASPTTTAAPFGFGYAVAMSADGQWMAATSCPVAVTASDLFATPVDGAVTLYSRSGSSWVAQQVIPSPGGVDQHFGFSVALDRTGTLCLVGAPTASDPGFSKCGAAYLYARSGSTWSLLSRVTAAYADVIGSATPVGVDFRRVNAGFGAAVIFSLQTGTSARRFYVTSYRGENPQDVGSDSGYIWQYKVY